MPSTKVAQMVRLRQTKWPPELKIEKIFKQQSPDPLSKWFLTRYRKLTWESAHALGI